MPCSSFYVKRKVWSVQRCTLHASRSTLHKNSYAFIQLLGATMTNRKLIASNSPWESIAGFSRAVRAGNLVCVSGTTASDAQGQTVCVGDPARQARHILQKVER